MGISPIGTIKIPGLSAKLNRIAEEVIGERQVSGSGLGKITWMLTQRQAYEDAVMAIEPEAMKMVNDGASVETAGRWAFGQRKVLQGTYQVGLSRNVLSDIGDRQLGHYGNVGGIQTAEQALERAGSWEGVIKSASKPGGDDIIRQVLKYYLDGGQ
jgi:hypothetical protein